MAQHFFLRTGSYITHGFVFVSKLFTLFTKLIHPTCISLSTFYFILLALTKALLYHDQELSIQQCNCFWKIPNISKVNGYDGKTEILKLCPFFQNQNAQLFHHRVIVILLLL